MLRWIAGILLAAWLVSASACSITQVNSAVRSMLTPRPTFTAGPLGLPETLSSGTPSPAEFPRSLPDDLPTPRLPAGAVISTSTPAPSPTPPPTPSPTLEESSDLLYISNNRLMRWDHVTAYASLLVENVTALALRGEARQVAMLRPQSISANGTELYNLDLLDFETKQISNLLQDTPFLSAMRFSSLGDRLAYIVRDVDDSIYSVDIKNAGRPQKVAECAKADGFTCQEVLWSPDGRSLAWSDSEGVWLADDRSASPRLVQSPTVSVKDPKGQATDVKVHFDQLSWSPDSRFLLVKIIPSASGVQWFGLLDTRQQRLVDIPQSGEFLGQFALLLWTDEGTLLLAHSNDPATSQPPFIQTWRVIPTNNEILIPEKFLYLGANEGQISQVFPENIALNPAWIQQFDAATFRLGMVNPEGEGPASLYQLNLEKNLLAELVEIPPATLLVLWSPDGSGALVVGENGQLSFASHYSGQLIDLRPVLGEAARDFVWLLPAPRQ